MNSWAIFLLGVGVGMIIGISVLFYIWVTHEVVSHVTVTAQKAVREEEYQRGMP